ncbi:MAG: hypothetical protein U0W24_06120 [Bacteroidales bacterium]
MAKSNSDPLFRLIKALSPSEKRYFKIFFGNSKSDEEAKFMKLFNLMDKQQEYDESKILEQEKSFKASQISNLKAHLYRQILQSLNNYNPNNDIEIKIRELLNHTNILYNRALYDQCWKMLEKARQLAEQNDKQKLLYEVIEFEKRLLTKLIRADIQEKVLDLVKESESQQKKLQNINTFQNLSIRLYSFYLQLGFIRNSSDFEIVNRFLYSSLPAFKEENLTFDEKNYLYNSLVGYYLFIQDITRGYEYAKKWVGLFEENPQMKVPKIENYIKAMHNLLVAQSKLFKYHEFVEYTRKFQSISEIEGLNVTNNISILLFKYSSVHLINKYFMTGNFEEGVAIVPEIASKLEKFEDYLDAHNVTIFYYKFACMYFGSENYQQSTFWLNKIINSKDVNIRSDIHGFARILNLISHWELKNMDLVDYFIRSTYRYLIKKDEFHLFQRSILKFLKKLSSISPDQLKESFIDLREKLLPLTNNVYEKRAFIYFDIISWLESKIYNKPNHLIIKEKAQVKIDLQKDETDLMNALNDV